MLWWRYSLCSQGSKHHPCRPAVLVGYLKKNQLLHHCDGAGLTGCFSQLQIALRELHSVFYFEKRPDALCRSSVWLPALLSSSLWQTVTTESCGITRAVMSGQDQLCQSHLSRNVRRIFPSCQMLEQNSATQPKRGIWYHTDMWSETKRASQQQHVKNFSFYYYFVIETWWFIIISMRS